MASLTKDDGDIPDSTDWLGTPLAGLMPVEQAFRCHVCKDFYNAPMTTSCNHTFCSLCIRRSLSVDGKCPLCRADDQELKLRGNWALREAVDAFCKARAGILLVARAPPPEPPRAASPKRKGVHDEVEDAPRSKRLRSSTRRSKTRAAEATAALAQQEVDEIEVPDSPDSVEYEPDDGLVACPICLKRMKPMQVDRHLDTTCPGEPQPQPRAAGPSRAPQHTIAAASKAPERLPLLSYSMLNDTLLRKKMSQLGLSTFGSRPLLERRHKEYVTLWNANCDSAQPKSKADLMRDLQVWERTLGGQAPTNSRSAYLGAQIKDKEFDAAAWAVQHDDSFRDLIANARKSRLKAAQKATEPSSSSTPNENSGAPSSSVLPERSWTAGAEVFTNTGPSSSSRSQVINGEITGHVLKGMTGEDTGKATSTEAAEYLHVERRDIYGSSSGDIRYE